MCFLCTYFGWEERGFSLLRVFNYKWMLNFVKYFSASIEMTVKILSFVLLMWCITLINLGILNHPCIPGMEPTWSCSIFLSIIVEFGLLSFLYIYIDQGYWPIIFFFMASLSGFGIWFCCSDCMIYTNLLSILLYHVICYWFPLVNF